MEEQAGGQEMLGCALDGEELTWEPVQWSEDCKGARLGIALLVKCCSKMTGQGTEGAVRLRQSAGSASYALLSPSAVLAATKARAMQ